MKKRMAKRIVDEAIATGGHKMLSNGVQPALVVDVLDRAVLRIRRLGFRLLGGELVAVR